MINNKQTIYFVGGAKGVGKSTLLDELKKHTGIQIVNTGDFFNYANKKKVANPKKFAKENMFKFFFANSPLIADTHYAGFIDGIYSGKFERGLYEQELDFLASKTDLELILIDMDPDLLLERRLGDKFNNRDYDFENLKKELDANRTYFHEYCEQLKKDGVLIKESDFDKKFAKLYSIFK